MTETTHRRRVMLVVATIAMMLAVWAAPAHADGAPVPLPTGQMQLVNQQASYAPGGRLEFVFAGCSPRGATRLELYNTPYGGNPVATYPSPTANVGGYVRAAVLLPTWVTSGIRYLSLLCTSVDGYAITATVEFVVYSNGWYQPTLPTIPGSAYLPPLPGTTPTPDPMARTGINAGTIVAASATLLVAGLLILWWVSRRQAALRPSPIGQRAGAQR